MVGEGTGELVAELLAGAGRQGGWGQGGLPWSERRHPAEALRSSQPSPSSGARWPLPDPRHIEGTDPPLRLLESGAACLLHGRQSAGLMERSPSAQDSRAQDETLLSSS